MPSEGVGKGTPNLTVVALETEAEAESEGDMPSVTFPTWAGELSPTSTS
jgi:hypothetical protein